EQLHQPLVLLVMLLLQCLREGIEPPANSLINACVQLAQRHLHICDAEPAASVHPCLLTRRAQPTCSGRTSRAPPDQWRHLPPPNRTNGAAGRSPASPGSPADQGNRSRSLGVA